MTGKIQDADNNSYHRVVSGYLALSTIFLAVTFGIFGAALLNPNMVQLQWTRKERMAKGPEHIARMREYHLEKHHRRTGLIAIFCFGLIILMLVASWGIYVWGAVTGNNQ